MRDKVDLTLTNDEALVLFDLLSRIRETNELILRHNAEFVVMSQISALLDEALVEPFDPNYASLLGQARDRLAAGFEGLAPGVVRGQA